MLHTHLAFGHLRDVACQCECIAQEYAARGLLRCPNDPALKFQMLRYMCDFGTMLRTVCDVVLHTRSVIDLEFHWLLEILLLRNISLYRKWSAYIYWPTQTWVVFPSIFTVAVAFGVVNVLRLLTS